MRSVSIICALLWAVLSSSLLAAEPAGLKVDKDKKSVTIDAKIAPRKLPKLSQIYPIEVVACWPSPKGMKAHETVVTIDVAPSDVHKALESIGLKPGKPIKGSETEAGTGPDLNIFIEILSEGTVIKRLGMDKVLLDPKTKKPFPKSVKFRFTGSVMTKPDPTKAATKYGADLTGTLIAVYPVTDETVIQSSLTMKEEKYLKLDVNSEVLPKEGTAVRLVIAAAK